MNWFYVVLESESYRTMLWWLTSNGAIWGAFRIPGRIYSVGERSIVEEASASTKRSKAFGPAVTIIGDAPFVIADPFGSKSRLEEAVSTKHGEEGPTAASDDSPATECVGNRRPRERRQFPELVPFAVGSGYARITSRRVLNAKNGRTAQVRDRVAQAASSKPKKKIDIYQRPVLAVFWATDTCLHKKILHGLVELTAEPETLQIGSRYLAF
ncbi:hypothetical protein B0H11DRAFT_1925142 [Mycena galericulata]|nr:hypothetical protein B0H11DRAFT_1925142 [Mycena galericulata]